MIDEKEAALIAHAMGHEVARGSVVWNHRAGRNYFCTTPGSEDDDVWSVLCNRGIAYLGQRAGADDGVSLNTFVVTDLGRRALHLWNTRDALDKRLVASQLYYIEDTRQVVGNCVLWWGKDRAGYFCALDDAGLYSGMEAADIVGLRSEKTDVAWPRELVEASAVRHVRSEPLSRLRAGAPRRDKRTAKTRKDAPA